jgi:predicted HTH domain antitoxin
MMDEMVTVQLTVPGEWARELKDRAMMLEVLGLGLEEYHFQRALALYQGGAGSIGYAAKLAGIPLRMLMERARQRGVLPRYDEQFAEHDVNQ